MSILIQCLCPFRDITAFDNSVVYTIIVLSTKYVNICVVLLVRFACIVF